MDAPTPVDILLVDDNPGKMLALETALAPLGQNLVRAFSGREALRQLLARDFATVILDVNMPDMDGFETARMIRSRGRTSTTPIIFVSAVNLEETDAHRGYSLGAVDYIFAPIIPEVLRAKVSVFVELHRKTEEARLQAQRLAERTRELEQSQRHLRMAERMATIGTLCAGLGHDMGNLLLPIGFWLDDLDPASLPREVGDGIENLRTCVEYLRRLSAGLRLVALDPEHDAGDGLTPLEEWRDETIAIFRNALPKGVTLRFELAPDLPPVRIARHQLTQVVFNLVQNAGEALRDRPEGLVRIWAEPDGETVRVGVSDNGPGMPPEVVARCFDPFFTTKTRSISTGLGLSLVNGIVQKAGGTMDVVSSPERGTTFTFAVRAAPGVPAVRPLAVVDLAEPRVRGYANGMLRGAGFEVVPEVPPSHEGAALLVTQPGERLEAAAAAFQAGRRDRRVLVYARSPGEAAGLPTFALRGGRSLGDGLRDFLQECAGARPIARGRAVQEQPA